MNTVAPTFPFSEFWILVQGCHQLNDNFNGGRFSLDAALALYNEAVEYGCTSATEAVKWHELSGDPDLAIWTEVTTASLDEQVKEMNALGENYASGTAYALTFPECHRVAADRWLLRCE